MTTNDPQQLCFLGPGFNWMKIQGMIAVGVGDGSFRVILRLHFHSEQTTHVFNVFLTVRRVGTIDFDAAEFTHARHRFYGAPADAARANDAHRIDIGAR